MKLELNLINTELLFIDGQIDFLSIFVYVLCRPCSVDDLIVYGWKNSSTFHIESLFFAKNILIEPIYDLSVWLKPEMLLIQILFKSNPFLNLSCYGVMQKVTKYSKACSWERRKWAVFICLFLKVRTEKRKETKIIGVRTP